MCGLKPLFFHYLDNRLRSHPSWVCGLKLKWLNLLSLSLVTPFVGVWIETFHTDVSLLQRMSHPSWVCGLKPGRQHDIECMNGSHPSWVCGLKLYILSEQLRTLKSHPSWVCGLKHCCQHSRWIIVSSHPSWVCGLKLDWLWLLL